MECIGLSVIRTVPIYIVDVSLYPWASQLCSASSAGVHDMQLTPDWQAVGCIIQSLMVTYLRSAFYKYSLRAS